MIPWDDFLDTVYEKVKEVYEEAEENNFDIDSYDMSNDGQTFGWALADTWMKIGDVFIFLASVFNLCDTVKDESPIIDSKGMKQGMQIYSLTLELLDTDEATKLNILEYETLQQSELTGKFLRCNIEIKRATIFSEKYSFQTYAKYQWLDE